MNWDSGRSSRNEAVPLADLKPACAMSNSHMKLLFNSPVFRAHSTPRAPPLFFMQSIVVSLVTATLDARKQYFSTLIGTCQLRSTEGARTGDGGAVKSPPCLEFNQESTLVLSG